MTVMNPVVASEVTRSFATGHQIVRRDGILRMRQRDRNNFGPGGFKYSDGFANALLNFRIEAFHEILIRNADAKTFE